MKKLRVYFFAVLISGLAHAQSHFLEQLKLISPEDSLALSSYVKSALTTSKTDEQKAGILLSAGTYLSENFEYEIAKNYLRAALVHAEDDLTRAQIYYQLGTVYIYQDLNVRSIEFYEKANEAYEQAGDSSGMANSLDRIGDNHNYVGQHEIALDYYQRSLLIAEAIGDMTRYSNVLGNIGGMLADDMMLDTAIGYYRRAIEIDKEINDSVNLQHHISGLAMTFESMGRKQEALEHHHEAYNIAYETDDIFNQAFCNQHLGYFYFRTNIYDSARHYMQITRELAVQMSNAQLLTNSLDVLKQVAFRMGSYREAYELSEHAAILADSLLQLQNVSKIASIQMENDLSRKEGEYTLLLAQTALKEDVISASRNLNIVLVISAALLLSAIVLLLLLNRSRKEKNLKILKDKSVIESQAEQLKELANFKSRFFANVSHDFRAPINLIMGYSDLIQRNESALSDDSKQFFEYIDSNTERLKSLTDEIHQLIQLEDNRFKLMVEELDFEEFANPLITMFRSASFSERIEFEYEAKVPKNFKIHVDKAAFEKIVYNLVDNAFKYNTTGKSVKVKVTKEGDQLVIQVADDGPGISEEQVDRVFDRYYRVNATDSSAKGQGIGLSLVKDLVQLHGGEIKLTSKPKIETVFEVRFPIRPK